MKTPDLDYAVGVVLRELNAAIPELPNLGPVTEEQLLEHLRAIEREAQQQTPIAEMLERCVEGWIWTAIRMVVLA